MVQQCFDAHYVMSNALLSPYRFLYAFDNALTTYVCAMRAGAFFLIATYVHLGSIICKKLAYHKGKKQDILSLSLSSETGKIASCIRRLSAVVY